jgi:lysyl endopeptidase
MRRKVGIVVGACAALVLAGASGAVAWAQTGGGGASVGEWHEAPSPAARPKTHKLPESAEADAAAGRSRVGELLTVDKPLEYGQPRETFTYPGASFVKLHFDRMAMKPGDYLTVANRAGTESYRYDRTGAAAEWAMSVTGDTAVLEIHRGGGPGPSGVRVDRVARGFTAPEQARVPEDQLLAPDRTGREESVCGGDESADAVCYKSADPVAFMRSKAVARLLINGTELCTAWRVGAKNRMITNNHCLANSADAAATEVWFNYQCTVCGGKDMFAPTKVRGDTVLATDHLYDFTLFTVANFASVEKFGYLTFDTARPQKGQELYVPQHPAGEPTKIAGALGKNASTCVVTDNAYTGYGLNTDVAYLCDTAGGSSGSPVLSRATNKVVALHHFGGCPNSGVRGDLLAAKLAKYL